MSRINLRTQHPADAPATARHNRYTQQRTEQKMVEIVTFSGRTTHLAPKLKSRTRAQQHDRTIACSVCQPPRSAQPLIPLDASPSGTTGLSYVTCANPPAPLFPSSHRPPARGGVTTAGTRQTSQPCRRRVTKSNSHPLPRPPPPTPYPPTWTAADKGNSGGKTRRKVEQSPRKKAKNRLVFVALFVVFRAGVEDAASSVIPPPPPPPPRG